MQTVSVKVSSGPIYDNRKLISEARFTPMPIWQSNFSKSHLPGATSDDMVDLHDQMAEHHAKMLPRLHQKYMLARRRSTKRALMKQMKDTQKLVKKHQKAATHFENIGKKNPAMRTTPYMPLSTRITHGIGRAIKGAGKLAFKGAKGLGHVGYDAAEYGAHLGLKGLSGAGHLAGRGINKIGQAGEHVVDHAANALQRGVHNVHQGAVERYNDFHDLTKVAQHHAKGFFSSLIPRLKHMFTSKRPNSPMTSFHNNALNYSTPHEAFNHHALQATYHDHISHFHHGMASLPSTKDPEMHRNLAVKHSSLARIHEDKAKEARSQMDNFKIPLAKGDTAPPDKNSAPKNLPKPVTPSAIPIVRPTRAKIAKPAPVEPVSKPAPKAKKQAAVPVAKTPPVMKPQPKAKKVAPSQPAVPVKPVKTLSVKPNQELKRQIVPKNAPAEKLPTKTLPVNVSRKTPKVVAPVVKQKNIAAPPAQKKQKVKTPIAPIENKRVKKNKIPNA